MTPSVSLLARAAGAEEAGPALPRGGTCGRIPARGGVGWPRPGSASAQAAHTWPAGSLRPGTGSGL